MNRMRKDTMATGIFRTPYLKQIGVLVGTAAQSRHFRHFSRGERRVHPTGNEDCPLWGAPGAPWKCRLPLLGSAGCTLGEMRIVPLEECGLSRIIEGSAIHARNKK